MEERPGLICPDRTIPVRKIVIFVTDAKLTFDLNGQASSMGGAVYELWLLLITKGLRVHMPPELHENRLTADLEACRWMTTVMNWAPLPGGVLKVGTIGRDAAGPLLHIRKFRAPLPWRANPLFVGVKWGDATFPTITLTLTASDQHEAYEWVRRRSPGGHVLRTDWGATCEFERGGDRRYVASLLTKRVTR